MNQRAVMRGLMNRDVLLRQRFIGKVSLEVTSEMYNL